MPSSRRAPRRIRLGPTSPLWVRGVAIALACLACTVGTALTTVQLTVLDERWWADGLEEVHAYERAYSEVLADPALAGVTADLLAGLPVDPLLVDANLRVVVPPATLQRVTEQLVADALAYLQGDIDQIDLRIPIDVVLGNVQELAASLVLGGTGTLPRVDVDSVEELASFLTDLSASAAAGRVPSALPNIRFDAGQITDLTDLIGSLVDPAARARLEPQLQFLLSQGDLDGALTVVARELARSGALDSVVALQRAAGGTSVDPSATIRRVLGEPGFEAVRTARFALGRVFPIALAVSTMTFVAALFVVGLVTRARGGRTAVWVAATGMGAGGAAVVGWWILWAVFGHPLSNLASTDTELPRSVRAILRDLGVHLDAAIVRTATRTTMQPVLIGAAALAVALALPPLLRALTDRRRRPLVLGAIGVAAVLLAASTWVSAPRTVDDGPARCNGSAQLCDTSYADVTFAASHNAMGAADAGFLGASQDLTLGDQLELGVRALLLDTHTWETPEQVQVFLDAQRPDSRALLVRTVDTLAPPRDGLWLCHDLCQLGATPLADGLRTIRAFAEDHPDEVLTLILEDGIDVGATIAGFEDSGIVPRLFVPDDTDAQTETRTDRAPKIRVDGSANTKTDTDRDPRWPTLGTLIERGTNVVVLSGRNGGGAPWLLPLYEEAMETPFATVDRDAFTCAAGRGGPARPLFLLNHWVTGSAPSRADAAVLNDVAFLVARAQECAAGRGRMPNYLAVDFVNVGGVVRAAEELNRIRARTVNDRSGRSGGVR